MTKDKTTALQMLGYRVLCRFQAQGQVAFLQKMLAGKLPIRPHAIAMTKNILFVEELKNGWKFYGKT